jgi:hypothetical protein
MCLIVPARVIALGGREAEIEMADGMRATVATPAA